MYYLAQVTSFNNQVVDLSQSSMTEQTPPLAIASVPISIPPLTSLSYPPPLGSGKVINSSSTITQPEEYDEPLTTNAKSAYAMLLGSPIRLSSEQSSKNISSPTLAYNNTNKEYIASWNLIASDSRDIVLQRFSPTGLIEGNITIPQQRLSQGNLFNYPDITYNSVNNQYLVSVESQKNPYFTGNISTKTFGQLLTAEGQPIGDSFEIGDVSYEPSVVYNPIANEYFRTARLFQLSQPFDVFGIYGQRLKADGTMIGSDINLDVNSKSGDTAPNGQVAFNNIDNQYLATWRRQSSGFAIEGAIVNPDGMLAGNPFEVVLDTKFNSGSTPFTNINTVFDPINKQFLVAYGVPNERQIDAQLIDATGKLIGSEIPVFSQESYNSLSVAFSDSLQTYLLVVGTGTGVKGQFLSADGKTINEPFIISNMRNLSNASVIYNPDLQEFVVAWNNNYSIPGNISGIYAQRIGSKKISVPEPTSIFGLLALATLSTGFIIKKQDLHSLK